MKTIWDFNGGYILIMGDVDTTKLAKSIRLFKIHSGGIEPTLYYPKEIIYTQNGDILDWSE
jgi:hypothetical protein